MFFLLRKGPNSLEYFLFSLEKSTNFSFAVGTVKGSDVATSKCAAISRKRVHEYMTN